MSVDKTKLALGLTGSFGSGCSTLAEALKSHGFIRVSLSEQIKDRWAKSNSVRTAKGDRPSRKELQDLGNDLRKTVGLRSLAEAAVQRADQLSNDPSIVFDGIRNLNEVEHLRQTFPNFFLITLWCSQNERWERIKEEYKGSFHEFVADDERDKDEELPYGQQVQLCVDYADIVLSNEEIHKPKSAAATALVAKVTEYIELLTGKNLRTPTQAEMAMATAFTCSLRSLCLKRQVGAVIADIRGQIISTGYNENPEPMAPCVKQFKYCYKDACVQEQIYTMLQKKSECPHCQVKIQSTGDLGDNYKCPSCGKSLMTAYAPDRGMSRCTAIHAENMAIMNASGKNIQGSIIYTTTFPCGQCARQIVYSGINEVVYIEPYPDPDSARFLKEFGGKRVRMFEGVKARAYERVFSGVRRQNEKRFELSR